MKKIIPKLALALAPIVLYLAVFVAFEPNNYFGLRATGSDNSPISRIRAFEKWRYVEAGVGEWAGEG